MVALLLQHLLSLLQVAVVAAPKLKPKHVVLAALVVLVAPRKRNAVLAVHVALLRLVAHAVHVALKKSSTNQIYWLSADTTRVVSAFLC